MRSLFIIILFCAINHSSYSQTNDCKFVIEAPASLEQDQEFKLSFYTFNGLKRSQETKVRDLINLYSGKSMINSFRYFDDELNKACTLWKRNSKKVKKYHYLGKIELVQDTVAAANTYFMRLHYVGAIEKTNSK